MEILAIFMRIICKEARLFKNQTVFYQVVVKFSCAKLQSDYGCTNTDELIKEIRKYLYCNFYNQSTEEFQKLHEIIYSNIIEFPCDSSFYADENTEKLRSFCAADLAEIGTNINKIIHGKRNIPKYWLREYEKCNGDIEPMVQRVFWILQYMGVYYGGCDTETNNEKAACRLFIICFQYHMVNHHSEK